MKSRSGGTENKGERKDREQSLKGVRREEGKDTAQGLACTEEGRPHLLALHGFIM